MKICIYVIGWLVGPYSEKLWLYWLRGHSFLLYRPSLSQPITCLFFSWGKLAYKWVCLQNFVIELAYMPPTNHLYLKKF